MAYAIEAEEKDDLRTADDTEYTIYRHALEIVQNYEQQPGESNDKRPRIDQPQGNRRMFDGVELPAPQRRPSTPYPSNNGNGGNRSFGPRSAGIIPITGAQRASQQPRGATPPPRPIPADEVERRHQDQAEKARQNFDREQALPKEKPHEDAPQAYRNRAPAADEGAANRIFDQVLTNAITIPVRDVLGASPDLRRLLQSYTRNRRTPDSVNVIADEGETSREDEVEEVFQYIAYDHLLVRTPTGEVAAHESLPLLSIHVDINGLPVDAIIDTGATICCISEQVWMSLGGGLLKKRSTVMRDANGNASSTMGALIDVPVTIGGIKFFLTFHVCKKAPFDCILGIPFCAVSSLKLHYRPSAEMVAEISDPNSDLTVLVPGVAKNKRALAYIEGFPRDF